MQHLLAVLSVTQGRLRAGPSPLGVSVLCLASLCGYCATGGGYHGGGVFGPLGTMVPWGDEWDGVAETKTFEEQSPASPLACEDLEVKRQEYGVTCKWCHAALLSFPSMTPSQLLAKVKVSDTMKLEVMQASKVARGTRKAISSSFGMSEITGYEVSAVFDLMSPAQFEDTFKMTVKAAGMKTVQLVDAQGQAGSFIIVRPPPGKEQLQLKMFSKVDLDVERTVLASSLRENQASELKQLYAKDLEKMGQLPTDTVMMTKQEIVDLVAAKKVAEEVAQATQALSVEAAATDAEKVKQDESTIEEPAELDDEDSFEEERLLLPSEIEKKKKEAAREAKKRAKGKGKSAKQGKGPSPPAQRQRLSCSVLADNVSVASQGSVHLQKLDAKSILEGVRPGQSLSQAKRTLDGMQACEAKVTLQDMYNLAALAQD